MAAFLAGTHSTVFPTAPAGLLFHGDAGMPSAPSFVTPNWNQWSPRVGIVFDPQGKGRETIRASYSLTHDYPEMYYSNYVTNSAPWGGLVQLTTPAGGFKDPWLGQPGGNPFPQASTGTFPAFGTYTNISGGTSLKSTYTEHWNAIYQRDLGDNFLITLTYLGNRTLHMWAALNLNPAVYIPGTCGTAACSTVGNQNQRRVLYLLNPAANAGGGYGAIFQTDDGASASYNAMVAAVQHRFSHNYTFLANYTLSHCINEADTGGDLGAASAMIENPYNRRLDRGNCGSDRRQMFNSSIIAQVPKFQDKALRWLASGWQVSGILTAATGGYGNVLTGTDTALTASYGTAPLTDRPNLIGNPYGAGTAASWFTRSAFVNNAAGTYGTLGRNALLQPGQWDIDAAVSRKFNVREKQVIEVRAEAFNLLNHVNLGAATTTLSSGAFGTITSAAAPRICEIALKYIF